MSDIFKRLFRSKYGLHVLFWSLQLVSAGLSEITIYDNDKTIFFLNLVTLQGLQIFICCLNVFLLLPRLYKVGRRLAYWGTVIGLVILYSFMISKLQHYFFSNYFKTSETLSKSLYHFILNGLSIIRYLVITVLIAFAREWLLKTFLENEQKSEQAATEIRFLRSQLNPHFLFNTLNNIYGLILTQSPHAKEIILKLSDIMKYTLYETNEEKVTLKKDIENVMNYIDLERLRQGNNAIIETQVNMGQTNQLVTPLLFLPLVENAFKHGVNSKARDAFFHFSLETDGKIIKATISNSKAIATASQPEEHGGIGLYNMQRRLSLFYPGKHSMEIKNEPDIYTVILIIATT